MLAVPNYFVPQAALFFGLLNSFKSHASTVEFTGKLTP